jgi:hypothetical protein
MNEALVASHTSASEFLLSKPHPLILLLEEKEVGLTLFYLVFIVTILFFASLSSKRL